MKNVSKKLISMTLSVSTFVCSAVYTAPVIAAPRLYEVKQETSSDTQNAERKTMRQLVEEAKAGNSGMTISKIPKGEAYIPMGTELAVEVVEELSSKKNKTGEAIKLRLCDNIIINDVIVVPAGAPVEGHITKAKGSGLLGRAGTLEFAVDSVKTINNVTIPLEYVGRIQAGSDGGAVAVVALVSVVGGIFMKGANVRIPAGTKIMSKVKTDTDLMTKLDNLAEAMDPAKPHGVSITIK